jgi:hypothetical protein
MKENQIKTKKQILKKRRKIEKTNKKKRKIQSGVAYDLVTTKKKHPPLEDLQNKTKKTCKLELPP